MVRNDVYCSGCLGDTITTASKKLSRLIQKKIDVNSFHDCTSDQRWKMVLKVRNRDNEKIDTQSKK